MSQSVEDVMNDTLLADECIVDRVQRDPPHWANDTIEAWDEGRFNQLAPFIVANYWTDQGSVNVFRVVGTQHWDYQGKSWLEFLHGGKRMDINLSLHAKNPQYYQLTERKRPMMYYMTLDGLSFYVGSDGNHRTCIARFDFHYSGRTMLHGATIYHHHVDWAFWKHYQQLKDVFRERSIAAGLQPYKNSLRREDTSGWKLDHYETRIKFEDYQGCTTEDLDKAGVIAKIDEFTKPRYRRFFGLMIKAD